MRRFFVALRDIARRPPAESSRMAPRMNRLSGIFYNFQPITMLGFGESM
jgi:hypothetical protein